MSRTLRTKRRSSEKVKDGYPQYVSKSCKHNGECPYCKKNRLFSSLKKLQERIYE